MTSLLLLAAITCHSLHFLILALSVLYQDGVDNTGPSELIHIHLHLHLQLHLHLRLQKITSKTITNQNMTHTPRSAQTLVD